MRRAFGSRQFRALVREHRVAGRSADGPPRGRRVEGGDVQLAIALAIHIGGEEDGARGLVRLDVVLDAKLARAHDGRRAGRRLWWDGFV